MLRRVIRQVLEKILKPKDEGDAVLADTQGDLQCLDTMVDGGHLGRFTVVARIDVVEGGVCLYRKLSAGNESMQHDGSQTKQHMMYRLT